MEKWCASSLSLENRSRWNKIHTKYMASVPRSPPDSTIAEYTLGAPSSGERALESCFEYESDTE